MTDKILGRPENMTGYKSSCILVPELRHNNPCLHKNKIRFDIKSAFSKVLFCS